MTVFWLIQLFLLSRPYRDAIDFLRWSPHCAMNDVAPVRSRHRSWRNAQLLPFGRDTVHGLYGVIHVSPLWGDLSIFPIRTFGICFRIHTPRLRRTPLREGTRGGGPSVAPGIRTFGICFWIHTPRLRRTPRKRGLAVAVCRSHVCLILYALALGKVNVC